MKAGLALLIAGLNLFGYAAQAQTDSVLLDDAMVTSNRIIRSLNQSAQSIHVLQKKEINSLPGTVPAEWLGNVSGVDIRQRGPLGVQADLGIRGGSFDQSLVLLNGMKLSDPQTGHHLFNLPLTSAAIEQIEVTKTSASRQYGINALTGAVNFVTKVPEKNMVYLGAYGGDFGLYGVQAGVAFTQKKVGQHISYAKSASNGYNRNTDFNTSQLFYQATIKGKKSSVNFIGGYTDRAFGAAGFYVLNSSEYEHLKTAFGGIQYQVKWNRLSIKAQTYYRYNQDHYIFLRDNPQVFQNRHFSHVAGAELHATYTTSLGITGVGIDSRTEQLRSNNLGTRERTINGLFAEHRFSFFGKKVLVTPGVYINQYNGSQVAAFPGIDASYAFKSGWVFFAAADKGMRLPTYTDLYYQGPSNTGNPDLKPEEAFSTEVGIKWTKGRAFASIAAFNRNSANLIDWAKTDATQKWKPLNVNEVTFKGIETNAGITLKGLLKRAAMGYTYIDANINQTENYLSRYALTHIRHQITGNVALKWWKQLEQTLTIRHINRVTLTDYTLIDTKLMYSFKQFTAYTEVTNVFDVSYIEAGFVNMPGRWYKLGFIYEFNY